MTSDQLINEGPLFAILQLKCARTNKVISIKQQENTLFIDWSTPAACPLMTSNEKGLDKKLWYRSISLDATRKRLHLILLCLGLYFVWGMLYKVVVVGVHVPSWEMLPNTWLWRTVLMETIESISRIKARLTGSSNGYGYLQI